MQVVSTTTEGERCGVQWRLTRHVRRARAASAASRRPATPVEIEGFDLLTVRDGLIQSNDAFTDSMTLRAADRA